MFFSDFSHLVFVSIFIRHSMRLPRRERFAPIMRSGVLLYTSFGKRWRIRAIEKIGGVSGLQRSTKTYCSRRDHTHFFNSLARAVGRGKNAPAHNRGEPFAPGKSRIGFHSHGECMEETH